MANYKVKENCEVKDPFVAFLLCLFLGTLGIHQFYLQNVKKGILYLLFGIFGWGTIIWYQLDPLTFAIIGTLRTIASILMTVLVVIDLLGLAFAAFAQRKKSKDERLYGFEMHFVEPEDRCYVPLAGDKEKEAPFIPLDALEFE